MGSTTIQQASPQITGLASRRLAWSVLQAVAAGAYADTALERALKDSALPPRDRALATDLAYGAIRQRALLDGWITAHGRVPAERQPPRLRWLLHVGLYQLLFLQRVPASAAVSTTVQLAREGSLARLAPVVNGLLRNVQRLREALPADSPPWQGLPLPEDPAASLALRQSLPPWLAQELLTWRPPAEAEAFACASNTPPPLDLRLNPLRTDQATLLARLAEAGLRAAPLPDLPEGLTLLDRPGDLRALPGYAEGHWSVQDRQAQRIVHLLDPQPGECVLDACAAPGGKATHCAERMANQGEVWAVDRSAARLQRLAINAERLGLGILHPLAADGATLLADHPSWRGRFDRILLDAPCSGLGTLARHADARWRQTPATIAGLETLQATLLAGLAPLLAPGGRFVYATCTVHPRENQGQTGAVLARQPHWQLLQERQWWPQPGSGDGFYAALFLDQGVASADQGRGGGGGGAVGGGGGGGGGAPAGGAAGAGASAAGPGGAGTAGEDGWEGGVSGAAGSA
ncbi:MAG: 16S rRNA (cytosine(967)-C(5))-methyltransferase [Cyanobium sp.]